VAARRGFQPGVEFDHHQVIDFEPSKVGALSALIEGYPHLVYEAHSTDYQTAGHLSELVRGHFALLKVGPALTFAMREALWSLDGLERELLGEGRASRLRETVLSVMSANPSYWKRYYSGSGSQLRLDCQYSLSDRLRYYWPDPAVAGALDSLMTNLQQTPPPLTLLSQYLPAQYEAVRLGLLTVEPRALVMHHVEAVLRQYAAACGNPDRHKDEALAA